MYIGRLKQATFKVFRAEGRITDNIKHFFKFHLLIEQVLLKQDSCERDSSIATMRSTTFSRHFLTEYLLITGNKRKETCDF